MNVFNLLAGSSRRSLFCNIRRRRACYFIFEEEEDAERYLGLLIDNATDTNLPELEINETDIDIASKICENKGYCYTIVTPNDFIIPPTNT